MDPPFSPSPALGLLAHETVPVFQIGAGDPSSGLQAYVTDTLQTEHSPQPS